MNRTEQRNLPVDCAKSLAISFVLLIHASADVLRGGAVGSGYWLEGLFWNSLSRLGASLRERARNARKKLIRASDRRRSYFEKLKLHPVAFCRSPGASSI